MAAHGGNGRGSGIATFNIRRPTSNILDISDDYDAERLDNKIMVADWTFYGNRPLRDPRTRWHTLDFSPSGSLAQQLRRHNIIFADSHAEWFGFENGLIDDDVSPPNGTRVPNPSFHWW